MTTAISRTARQLSEVEHLQRKCLQRSEAIESRLLPILVTSSSERLTQSSMSGNRAGVAGQVRFGRDAACHVTACHGRRDRTGIAMARACLDKAALSRSVLQRQVGSWFFKLSNGEAVMVWFGCVEAFRVDPRLSMLGWAKADKV